LNNQSARTVGCAFLEMPGILRGALTPGRQPVFIELLEFESGLTMREDRPVLEISKAGWKKY
jgi:hypothetical protein